MGISVQEFLAGREPCEVCDANGDQEHCISELLSRQDSCILYNSIELNQDNQTLNDTVLLQELRYLADPRKVLDYYIRATAITSDINSRRNRIDIWNTIYENYVVKILHQVRAREREIAFDKIMAMVEELEQEYGIKH